jgi:hypothetical protein
MMCNPARWAPCPECGGDGGFEEAGSGKWSACTFCDGTGEVESEAAEGLRDLEERCDTEERTDGSEKL